MGSNEYTAMGLEKYSLKLVADSGVIQNQLQTIPLKHQILLRMSPRWRCTTCTLLANSRNCWRARTGCRPSFARPDAHSVA